MSDPETRAWLDDYCARALASFPLSRVTETFHDEMLGALPPTHLRGVPGFFISEALSDGVHAQFVRRGGRFYGGYVAIQDPASHITFERIAAFDAANPDPPVLAWYPDMAEGDAA